MAQNVQNVTLALTLPITCHICLGKVRQPVICVNNHVFCSVCIELWLKNNNQCPACRVPITPDNPCKDIIGGTGENECMLSHSVRKHLRKTRLELLHKEYEEEIESLVKETEELKQTNLILEERLDEVAEPDTISSSCNCGNKEADNRSSISDELLEEWNRKLEMVNAANKKVTEDIEKLKEENSKLKNKSIEHVRENLRLKNEVDLRSPQKFGRFTVAALQAKVDQYEREMSRLKKALERSDQYIEELEARVEQVKRPPEDKPKEKSQCANAAFMEVHVNGAQATQICQEVNAANCKTGINSEDSKSSTRSTSNGYTSGLNKAQFINGNVGSPELKNKLSGYSSNMLDGNEQIGKGTVKLLQDFGSPSSSLPFSSLQLNTPDSKANCSSKHANLKKPLTYLRKLVFDDLPKKKEVDGLASSKNENSLNTGESTTHLLEPKPTFLNFCYSIGDSALPGQTVNGLQVGKPGANAADQSLTRLKTKSCEDLNRPRTSSKNSMDTTFHDKASELNYMMCDLESQKSRYHGNVSRMSPKQVRLFQSNSTIRTCKASEKATISHQAKSGEPKAYGSYTPCSPSVVGNSEHSHFFKGQLSGDIQNADFDNNLSNTNTVSYKTSSQSEEEVIFQPSSVNLTLPGHNAESTWPSSCISQNYNNSPPAKRKMLNPCSDSP